MHDANNTAELVERIVAEGPIGCTAAARFYGNCRGSKPTAGTTPYRHMIKGIPLADGTILKLESIRISGRMMTSKAAVLRFFTAQNGDNPSQVTQARNLQGSRRTRNAAEAAAERELDALGVK